MLFGRWAIAVGLSTVLALTPSFGPNHVAIAVLMMIGSTMQSAFLAWVIDRQGMLPRYCALSDHIFVAVAAVLAPITYPWGLIVMAITIRRV